jgi:hypothetical protein
MNEIASVFMLASALSATPAEGHTTLRSLRSSVPHIRMAQFTMGRLCVTKVGTCSIPPRPLNTQCFCGNVPGIVRDNATGPR